MKTYHYGRFTGEYLGISDADIDPISKQPMIPAFATATAPPTPGENQKVVWQNGAWTLVDIPQPEPEPEPTADELQAQELVALDAEYQPQFKELQLAWAAANLDGNNTLAAELQADYADLKAKYQTKREAIISGG